MRKLAVATVLLSVTFTDCNCAPAPCSDSRDCAPGETCTANVCRGPGNTGGGSGTGGNGNGNGGSGNGNGGAGGGPCMGLQCQQMGCMPGVFTTLTGTVFTPNSREAAYLAKVGFDKRFNDVRFRLTGSFFSQSSAASNTLYGGDRAGSRYNYVLENTAASSTGNAWSGNVDPLMKDRLTSMMVNPFVRVGGFEFFGTYEQAKGRASSERADRTFTQMATEFVYRFAENDKFFLAARWNDVKGEYLTAPGINVTRMQVGGGWFLTPSLMAKLEAVQQEWKNFPANDIRNGGKFKGVVLEAVISF